METSVQTAGEKEKAELLSELQGLKLEERSEETQAHVLVSKSELLREEFAKERDGLVNQLQTRMMVERESMELHRSRIAQEAAAYKAEIELAVQKQRLRDEAEEKIAQAERMTEMLEKEREVAKMRADYDSERTKLVRDAQQKEYQLREYEVALKQQEFEQRSRAEALEQQRRTLEQLSLIHI